MNLIENDLTEKQSDFQAALNEQFDVLRYDKLNNGLVRFVAAPLGDIDVEWETIQVQVTHDIRTAREHIALDVRVKGFLVDQAGTLLAVQDMSNQDNPDGSPQWLVMQYSNDELLKLQEGLR